MVRRGELGEREAAEGWELFCLWREDGDRGESMKKHPPKSRWRESGKVGTATGTELKGEKGERRGFKFHSDYKQGERRVCNSTADTWRCSGGKGEGWCQVRVVIFHNPWGTAATGSCKCSWGCLAPAAAQWDPLAEDLSWSKPQSLRSEGAGNTAASEIKLRREVPPGSLKAWSRTV